MAQRTLREFKKQFRLTTAEVAEMFGIEPRQYYHYRDEARVLGRVGERKLVVKKTIRKVVGSERPLARVASEGSKDG